jgi:hypothetical protein
MRWEKSGQGDRCDTIKRASNAMLLPYQCEQRNKDLPRVNIELELELYETKKAAVSRMRRLAEINK